MYITDVYINLTNPQNFNNNPGTSSRTDREFYETVKWNAIYFIYYVHVNKCS